MREGGREGGKGGRGEEVGVGRILNKDFTNSTNPKKVILEACNVCRMTRTSRVVLLLTHTCSNTTRTAPLFPDQVLTMCCIALYITTKIDGSKNCRVPNNKASAAEEEELLRTCRVADYDNSNNYP
jgi:hypothetical protein